ncbi:MAG TPA: D-Ala-D-Ala carboxypeptidase family metallohydrolase [Gemmatimonadaceae bacterium]|nr:D-Ala-D-Ala carboxypeptidase family metallohydrolase [Gemmatimonadaceae bacterium]
MPDPSRNIWRRKGMGTRGERRFHIGSSIFIGLLAMGWSWSIANARDGVPAGVPTAAGILSRALTDVRSPSVAYLTGAALDIVTPLRGESGKLRASMQAPGQNLPADSVPAGTVSTYSSPAVGAKPESTTSLATPARPGIWSLALAIGEAIRPIADFSVITLKPASAEKNGRIGLYYIGNWPSARKTAKATYTPPAGFIEVTQQQQNTFLSEHFRLRDFFPHDQANVWPKYIVVKMELVDKLELVLIDLEQHGIPSRGVRVLSGFRTPQYNRGGGDTNGRASLSRHMYGDAADIFIDNDGNGNMDDLNHDGKLNLNDARVILAAVNRVEAAHPSLIGGCGVYPGTSAHGPFTHIDTRGYPARWIGTGDN